MAGNAFGVNDASAVKLWSKMLAAEIPEQTYIGRFMGTSANSLFQQKTETSKSEGDQIKFSLRMLASGDGTSEGETQEGNEESLTLYQDSLLINELGHAHRVKKPGTIDAQRISFDMRDEAKESLKDWWARRLDQMAFNQLCGYTPETNAKKYGFNAPVAPSNFIRANAQATDQAIGSSDKFTVSLIDKAVEIAKTRAGGPRIRPVRVNGKDMYVMFIHPQQETQLRIDTGTSGWLDIQKALIQGGESDKSGIFNGALGVWNNVVLHSSEFVTQGVNGSTGAAITTVRRAVLCGAQSLSLAYGQANGAQKYKWVEQDFDYDREVGVRASTILGMKKTRFNSIDFGVIVCSTYATAAS